MNPITLPIAELKPALAGLSKVISPKANLPILHHVKIERTSDGWIALTGTDLDRFVTMRLEHPAEGDPAAVLVPYEQLQHLARNCGKDEQIHIHPDPKATVIRFALARQLGEQRVKPIPVDDFPPTPRIKTEPIPLPPELRRSLNEAMECASTDATRYVLNGAFIDASDPKANYLVGTNGRHLYSANSFVLPLKKSLIIPTHKFIAWREFNTDGEWQMKADEEHVQLSSRKWRFIAKQIDGEYRKWRQVMPEANVFKTTITMDPEKVDAIINLIHRLPCHDEQCKGIGLQWKGRQLNLLARADGDEKWLKVPVPDAKGEGPEVTIFLNRRYLTKALEFGLNTIGLIDSISPLRFTAKGRVMIVMPVREGSDQGQPQPHQQPQPANNHQQPEPVNNAPQRPVSSPTAPEERRPMPPQPNSQEPPLNGPKSAIEEAIDMTIELRDKLNEGYNLLRDLSLKLKHINREQRTNTREYSTLR